MLGHVPHFSPLRPATHPKHSKSIRIRSFYDLRIVLASILRTILDFPVWGVPFSSGFMLISCQAAVVAPEVDVTAIPLPLRTVLPIPGQMIQNLLVNLGALYIHNVETFDGARSVSTRLAPDHPRHGHPCGHQPKHCVVSHAPNQLDDHDFRRPKLVIQLLMGWPSPNCALITMNLPFIIDHSSTIN